MYQMVEWDQYDYTGLASISTLIRTGKRQKTKFTNVFCINEVEAQVLSQNQTVEVLTAGGGVAAAGGVKHGVFDVIQLAVDVVVQTQISNDAGVTGADLVEAGIDGFHGGARLDQVVATIEHIGDLGIALFPLTGSGGNNVAAGGVGFDDGGDLTEMLGIGKRATAELNNFDRHDMVSFVG